MIGQEKTVLVVGPGLYLNYYKFPLTVCGGSGSLAKFQGKKPLDALVCLWSEPPQTYFSFR